jgi:zinc-binding alcohol dehydrogenase/oxidoreductase
MCGRQCLRPDFSKIPDLCNPGGRIVFFGGTAGNIPEMNARPIFWKQLQILGTTMGTQEEFKAMLAFVNEHKIVPVLMKYSRWPMLKRRLTKWVQLNSLVN